MWVSIHAPAKGATRNWLYDLDYASRFNPRTREGCDLTRSVCRYAGSCFNPRTREGCDMS